MQPMVLMFAIKRGAHSRYASIQERIAQETEIPAGSQLILWHDKHLSDVVDLSAAAQSYPKTITKTMLYVVNKLSMEGGVLKLSYIRKDFFIFRKCYLTKNITCHVSLYDSLDW